MAKIQLLLASGVACALTATGAVLLPAAPESVQAVPATERTQFVSRAVERNALVTPSAAPSSAAPAEVAPATAAPVTPAPATLTPKPAPSTPAKPKPTASDTGATAAGVAPATGNTCTASFYDEPQMTASGERFNPNAMTAAHKTLPLGTRLKVTNPRTGATVIVRINDRGPYVGGRCLDLSRAAFAAIGNVGSGTMTVAWQTV